MALTYAEPRLAPLGNTFQEWDEQPCAKNRRHSYPRYAPRRLLQVFDFAFAFSEDDSTTAAGSPASQAPSSLGDHEQADSLDEGSSPELWPDTDSDDDIYEWSPCSRRRVVVPSPDEAGARCDACRASRYISVASEDDATTAPGSLTSQAPSILGDHEQVDSLDDEVNALRGAQRGEAQRRYQTERKKQQRRTKKMIRRAEALAGAAEPRRFIVSL
jgi:hypothetical protein